MKCAIRKALSSEKRVSPCHLLVRSLGVPATRGCQMRTLRARAQQGEHTRLRRAAAAALQTLRPAGSCSRNQLRAKP
ncbi:hypothetical protein NDU88_007980 [Pleurodeles waltl]|uniref:Uncharacterized protein n=1 Tax=Pleurodeles waltl TaxID=8319 RepID=A0AAV7QQD1_PLEWA|nr:hypothetical protein NDU88_007980 [Pleurodeles waltl]